MSAWVAEAGGWERLGSCWGHSAASTMPEAHPPNNLVSPQHPPAPQHSTASHHTMHQHRFKHPLPTWREEHVILCNDHMAVPPPLRPCSQKHAVEAPLVVLRQPGVPRLVGVQRCHPRRFLPKGKAAGSAQEVGGQCAHHLCHLWRIAVL